MSFRGSPVVASFPVAVPIAIAKADRPPIGRLTPEAIAWLAEAAAAADEFSDLSQVIWIALRLDGFVVQGVRGHATAMRPVPLEKAGQIDANLLLAAVLAVNRELNAPPLRGPSRWRGHGGRR
jgi:hypothetical protein